MDLFQNWLLFNSEREPIGPNDHRNFEITKLRCSAVFQDVYRPNWMNYFCTSGQNICRPKKKQLKRAWLEHHQLQSEVYSRIYGRAIQVGTDANLVANLYLKVQCLNGYPYTLIDSLAMDIP